MHNIKPMNANCIEMNSIRLQYAPRGQTSKSRQTSHAHTHSASQPASHSVIHINTIDLEGMGKYCKEMPEDVSSLIDSAIATATINGNTAHHVHTG